jgi:purine-nucleoside phosphorylase
MLGRIHYYEYGDLEAVTFPIRVLARLGIRRLIVTNAAGGINRGLRAGDLMLIRDHIGLFFPNPLVGMNFAELGPRFPDMSCCYSRSLRELALKCAGRLRLTLKEGIYAALPGPSYETPAEIKMLKKLGADAVGMSTVPEATVARQMGVECLGISCISNLAAGLSKSALSHDDVLRIGRQTGLRLVQLINALLGEISRFT